MKHCFEEKSALIYGRRFFYFCRVKNRSRWNTNLPVDNSNFIKGLATICLDGVSRICSVFAEHQVVMPQIAVLQALEWSPRVKLILKYGLHVTEFRTEVTESKTIKSIQ